MTQPQPAFLVYDASAGSGKTFTLVRTYLSLILQTESPDAFSKVLAITFTNKAVGEMKERILQNLMAFAVPDILHEPSDLFRSVCEQTALSPETIHQRARKALPRLLHQYAFFSVETIDGFNHRLIRTFARDLKLNTRFEVELDTESLRNEAIDRLVGMVGNDETVTKILVRYALEKIEDDKSWDITYSLRDAAKILNNENHLKHIQKLRQFDLGDFANLRRDLRRELQQLTESLKKEAACFAAVLHDNGLSYSEVSGKYVEGFFNKLSAGDMSVTFSAKWQENMGSKPLYYTKATPQVIAAFERAMPKLVKVYHNCRTKVLQYWLLDAVRKNTTTLSLLHLVQNHFENIQKENNTLSISAFNKIISDEIKGQPAPFLYERLGERYHHFFIDEFQDTSTLQWDNLRPLIDNSLSQVGDQAGSLLLVGDAKQSIYRWRGASPEQFMKLYGNYNPFSNPDKKEKSLDTNYRSYDEIIQFNNHFFTHLAGFFESEAHSRLYRDGNQQKSCNKPGGYVSLSFVDAPKVDDGMELYPEKVLEIVRQKEAQGFAYGDICVLVRKNKQAVAVAQRLAEENIDVLSNEALLLANSEAVVFVIQILELCENTDNNIAKVGALYFLHSRISPDESLHDFIDRRRQLSPDELFALPEFGISFSFDEATQKPLYELCESIIDTFRLRGEATVYLLALLDVVYEFSIKTRDGLSAFLHHWEGKKETLSLSPPQGTDAVNIMTVHKSKGLEFPVVILPFADFEIYEKELAWLSLPESLHPFDEFLVNLNKDIGQPDTEAGQVYEQLRETNRLDAVNLLYVAFTRAREQLFVISNLNTKVSSVSGLISDYLKNENLWEDTERDYSFGSPKRVSDKTEKTEKKQTVTLHFPKRGSYAPVVANSRSLLWGASRFEAIEKGNRLHDALARIRTADDVETVLQVLATTHQLSETEQREMLQTLLAVIQHPELTSYFEPGNRVLTEREIITKDGQLLRPDRINLLDENTAVLIDYKTGNPSPQHTVQLEIYQTALEEMDYRVAKKLLVYTSKTVTVVAV